MEFKILQKPTKKHQVYITDDVKKISQVQEISEGESAYSIAAFNAEQTIVTINRYGYFIFIYLLKNKKQTGKLVRFAVRQALNCRRFVINIS